VFVVIFISSLTDSVGVPYQRDLGDSYGVCVLLFKVLSTNTSLLTELIERCF
jgi:hypothetical protein